MRDDSNLIKREQQARAARMSRVEPEDLARFEGEGGLEAPEPATPDPKQQGLFAGRDETRRG